MAFSSNFLSADCAAAFELKLNGQERDSELILVFLPLRSHRRFCVFNEEPNRLEIPN